MENGRGSKPAKYIIVNLPDHKITVTEGGNTVRFLNDFSTGKEGHLTPMFKNGSIAIDKRYKMYHSHHYNDHNGKPAEMPFALFLQMDLAAPFMQATQSWSRMGAYIYL